MNTLNLVFFNIGGKDNFEPADPFDNVPRMDENSFVVLNQGAPIWRYIKAFQRAKNEGAGVIATKDSRLRAAVVVDSNVVGWNVGDIFDIGVDRQDISLNDKMNL